MVVLTLSSPWLPSLGVLGSAIVLVLILSILAVIRTESSPTPINQLIRLDCLLRLTNIPYILYWTGLFNYWGLDSPSTAPCASPSPSPPPWSLGSSASPSPSIAGFTSATPPPS